jgi:hypothetical protein
MSPPRWLSGARRAVGVIIGACSIVTGPIAAEAHGADVGARLRRLDEHTQSVAALEAFVRSAAAEERYTEAIDAVRLGMIRLPSFSRGYLLLAHLSRRSRAWADAATYYRAYLACRPDDAVAYQGLAQSLEQLGDARGAAVATETFLWLASAANSHAPIESLDERSVGTSGAPFSGELPQESRGREEPRSAAAGARQRLSGNMINPFDEGDSAQSLNPNLIDPFSGTLSEPSLNPNLIDPFSGAPSEPSFNPNLIDPFHR